jgi:hypothetical protein
MRFAGLALAQQGVLFGKMQFVKGLAVGSLGLGVDGLQAALPGVHFAWQFRCAIAVVAPADQLVVDQGGDGDGRAVLGLGGYPVSDSPQRGEGRRREGAGSRDTARRWSTTRRVKAFQDGVVRFASTS